MEMSGAQHRPGPPCTLTVLPSPVTQFPHPTTRHANGTCFGVVRNGPYPRGTAQWPGSELVCHNSSCLCASAPKQLTASRGKRERPAPPPPWSRAPSQAPTGLGQPSNSPPDIAPCRPAPRPAGVWAQVQTKEARQRSPCFHKEGTSLWSRGHHHHLCPRRFPELEERHQNPVLSPHHSHTETLSLPSFCWRSGSSERPVAQITDPGGGRSDSAARLPQNHGQEDRTGENRFLGNHGAHTHLCCGLRGCTSRSGTQSGTQGNAPAKAAKATVHHGRGGRARPGFFPRGKESRTQHTTSR